MGNATVLVTGRSCCFGWDKALYSIIFQFTSTRDDTICFIRNITRSRLFIVTELPYEIYQEIHGNAAHHSATEISATGMYSQEPKTQCCTASVSSTEAKIVTRNASSEADPKALINVDQRRKRSKEDFIRRGIIECAEHSIEIKMGYQLYDSPFSWILNSI